MPSQTVSSLSANSIDPSDSADRITRIITDFVAESPANRLFPDSDEPAFDTPIVGFASGADPLFDRYVEHIGHFYFTPMRLFNAACPADAVDDPAQLTVISWILPATAATRADQSRSRKQPCQRWALTRLHGENFNVALRQHVAEILTAAGAPAVAPMQTEVWSRSDEGPWAPCSNWSERHAAHAAGLGTFGLSDGLITPVGKAMRTGSVIARIHIPPTPKPYPDHHAYCLHFSHGTCGRCIDRCPVQAISRNGHDKKRCMAYTEGSMNTVMKKKYGVDTYACGLCQTAVPCMSRIPDPADG